METNNNEGAVEVRHPDVSYDPRDLNHHVVFLFLGSLAVSVFIVALVLWGAFRLWGGDQFAGHQSTNPIMTSNEQLKEIGGDPAISFPKPNLQPNPIADLNKFRIHEEERMNSYGWVDPAARKIHMPIERAIDILGDSWSQEQSLVTGATASAQPMGQAPKKARSAPTTKPKGQL